MKGDNNLFIGGPWDGERHDFGVRFRVDVYSESGILTGRYKRQPVYSGDHTIHYVYVYEDSENNTDIVSRLIAGYSSQTKKNEEER